MEEVNQRAPYRFTLDYQFDRDGDPTNAYCRSDHYMFARFGIPVTFFSAAAWYIDYHMVSDEPQYIAYERTARIGNFIRDYVRELANLRTRPPLTRPKPGSGRGMSPMSAFQPDRLSYQAVPIAPRQDRFPCS